MLFPMLGRELFSLERLPNKHEGEKLMKYLHSERIYNWEEYNSSVKIRYAAKTSDIRYFSQNIRSGNTDAYHPRVYIRKVPAL